MTVYYLYHGSVVGFDLVVLSTVTWTRHSYRTLANQHLELVQEVAIGMSSVLIVL